MSYYFCSINNSEKKNNNTLVGAPNFVLHNLGKIFYYLLVYFLLKQCINMEPVISLRPLRKLELRHVDQ